LTQLEVVKEGVELAGEGGGFAGCEGGIGSSPASREEGFEQVFLLPGAGEE